MKKRILAVETMGMLVGIIAVIFAVTLYFVSRDNPRTVLVGVEDFAPFISLNKAGEMVGISAMILQRVAVNENLKLVPTKPKPLNELLTMLEAGEIDVLTSVMKTPERNKIASFTKSYITLRASIVTMVPVPKSVCYGRGFAIEDWIHEHRPELTVVIAENASECIAKMLLGVVDSIVIDDITLATRQVPRTWKQTPLDFSYPLAFAVSRKKPELLAIFELSAGRIIYHTNCVGCHGMTGKGDVQPDLHPKARDFTAAVIPRDRAIDAVTNGHPGTAMMSWKNELSPKEIEEVVTFVSTFAPR